ALTYAPRQQPVPVAGWPGTSEPARPELYAPVGATETFRQIVGCWGNDGLIELAFAIHEYRPSDALELGPLQVRFCEVPHYTRSFAVELSIDGGGRLTYSGDCR